MSPGRYASVPNSGMFTFAGIVGYRDLNGTVGYRGLNDNGSLADKNRQESYGMKSFTSLATTIRPLQQKRLMLSVIR